MDDVVDITEGQQWAVKHERKRTPGSHGYLPGYREISILAVTPTGAWVRPRGMYNPAKNIHMTTAYIVEVYDLMG